MSGCWNLRLVKRLEPITAGVGAPVTSILPVGSSLYVGDDNGRVVSFYPPHPFNLNIVLNSIQCSMNGIARSMNRCLHVLIYHIF
jgi:hypothetical protein